MELHQLKYFVQVAEMESISRAADVLHLSQPAISKNIIKLEEELGAQLFDRVGKRIYLNDRGKLFLHGVEKALQDLNEAAALMGNATNGAEGSVSVMVFGPQTDATACVAGFMGENPRLHVTLNVRQRTVAPGLLRDFDLVFYPVGPAFASISGIPYSHTRTWLCVSEKHPLAGERGPVDLARFKDDPFIFTNVTPEAYDRSHRLCVEGGFSPWVRAVVSNTAVQMELVRSGLGVCLADAPVGRQGVAPQAPGIVYLELKDAVPDQTLCLATRPVHDLSPAGRSLLAYALGYFGLDPEDEELLARFDEN